MFNNVVLDVFIGLVFIYLLYSLLATVIQEILAQWFSLRSRMLIKALRRMLEDDDINSDDYWSNNSLVGFGYSVRNLLGRFFFPIKRGEKFVRQFYNHPTIKYLGENRLFSKPAYLHSHNFSQTIIQILRGDQYDGRFQSESTVIEDSLKLNILHIRPETLRHLKLLFADARQDSNLFKLKLEDWFDETMQRCTGWYKKQTQTIMIMVGFMLAWAFNVDTIAITKILSKDKNAREQLVQLAISRQKDYGIIIDTLSKTTIVKKEIKKAGDTSTTIIETSIKSDPSQTFLDSEYKNLKDDATKVQGILGLNGLASHAEYQKSCCLKIIGWIITALAISLGASFWFDLLNRLVKLRGAGTKPNTAADTDVMNNRISNPTKDKNNIDIKG